MLIEGFVFWTILLSLRSLSSINSNLSELLFTNICGTYIHERYLNSSTWIVDDSVFFPFFSFFPRLRHMSTSNSKISANDSTDIPIQRPTDPPRSERKFASCKIIEKLKKRSEMIQVYILDRIQKCMLVNRNMCS